LSQTNEELWVAEEESGLEGEEWEIPLTTIEGLGTTTSQAKRERLGESCNEIP
jgi:hypothetical protein